MLYVRLLQGLASEALGAHGFTRQHLSDCLPQFQEPFALIYPRVFDKYTYADPSEKTGNIHIKGSDDGLTEDAKEWVRQHPRDNSPELLVSKFPKGDVWTSGSIEHTKRVMFVTYTCLVMSLATAIFCLLEANVDVR